MAIEDKLLELLEKRQKASLGGGQKKNRCSACQGETNRT